MTDEEIRTYVYSNTFQETSPEIEAFINGMIAMRDMSKEDVNIYERDGDTVYQRKFGSDPSTRVKI